MNLGTLNNDSELFRASAEAVNEIVSSLTMLREWPEVRCLLTENLSQQQPWLLSLPIISCLSVGGTFSDGVYLTSGWFILNQALHLLDSVEDHDFKPDNWISQPEEAVNVSTALTFAAYHCFSAIQSPGGASRVANIVSECGFMAARGQHMGFNKPQLPVSEALQAYWQATILKSGSLFRMAMSGGAAAGTDDRRTIDALGDYGTALGVILQVLDDCQDVLKGTDATQYEITLPLLLYSAKLESEQVAMPDVPVETLPKVLEEAGIPQAISQVLLEWQRRAFESLAPLEDAKSVSTLKKIVQDILQ